MKTILILMILFTPILFSTAYGDTTKLSLKTLAQASSFLLAQSELVQDKKASCYKSSHEISQASQLLKSWIDQKMTQLTDDDYKILKYRVATCEIDCSCPIYSLAFENKVGFLSADLKKQLDDKASALKSADHLKCAETNQFTCETPLIRALK